MSRPLILAALLVACGIGEHDAAPGPFRETRIEVGPAPVSVLVRDVNRDGFSEERQRRIRVETDPHPHEVRAPDVDGDGHADLLVDARSAGLLRVFRGRGDGSFVPAEAVNVGGDPYLRVAVADLDGDGADDALVTSYVGSELAVLLTGAPDGQVIRLEVRDNPWGVAAGDLDGDGRAEVVTADNGGEEISVFFHRGG